MCMAWKEHALGSSSLGLADASASTFCYLGICGHYQTCQLDLSADTDILRNPTGKYVNTKISLRCEGQLSHCAETCVLSLGWGRGAFRLAGASQLDWSTCGVWSGG